MPERSDCVGATHDFHDSTYAKSWAERFSMTQERHDCFDHLATLAGLDDASKVLELGSGPGYLAHYLLSIRTVSDYCCVDYSSAMLSLAKTRLFRFFDCVRFYQLDLLRASWSYSLERDRTVVVSCWCLHDLGSHNAIASVYRDAWKLLVPGGILINVDFIKPNNVAIPFERGRIPIADHITILGDAGFSNVECTREFATDIDDPRSDNNFACLVAQKPVR